MKKLMTVAVSALCAAVVFSSFAEVLTPENFQSQLATIADGSTYEFGEGVFPVSAASIRLADCKNVTLVGAGAGKTILEPADGFHDALLRIVRSEGVTIKDMTLRNANNTGSGTPDADIVGRAALSATAFGAFGGAVLAADSTDTTFTDCSFVDNKVSCTVKDCKNHGSAIFLSFCYNTTVAGCTFDGNTGASSGGAISSFHREIEKQLFVSDSVFTRNGNTCIWGDGTAAKIVNCLFAKNLGGANAVYLSDQNAYYYRDPKSDAYNVRWRGTSELRDSSFVWNRGAQSFTMMAIEGALGKSVVSNVVMSANPFVVSTTTVNQGYTVQDGYWFSDQYGTATVQMPRSREPRFGTAMRVVEGNVAEGHGYTFPADWPENATREVRVTSDAELEAAIADLRSGDRIRIAAGEYAAGAYVLADVDDLEVTGEGEGAVFDGQGAEVSAPVFTFSGVNGLVVSNLTVRNCECTTIVKGSTYPIAFSFVTCMAAKAAALTVSNCNYRVTSAKTSGVMVQGALFAATSSTQLDATGIRCLDCVYDVSQVNSDQHLMGFLFTSGLATIRNSVFRNCLFHATRTGSRLYGVATGASQGITYKASGTEVSEDPRYVSTLFRMMSSLVIGCGRSQEEGSAGRTYIICAGNSNGGYYPGYYNCTFTDCYGSAIGGGVNCSLALHNCVLHNITKDTSNDDPNPGAFYNFYYANQKACSTFFRNCHTDLPVADYNTAVNGISIGLASNCLNGDPLLDADGRPTDTDEKGVSPLVDAGASRGWQTLFEDPDLDGNVRSIGYLTHGSGQIDIGAYELPEVAYRLTTEDYEVGYDGKGHGPRYTVVRNFEDVDPAVEFSTESAAGPWSSDEPQAVDGGRHTFWVKVSAPGYAPVVKPSTVLIIRKIEGNVYVAPGGTGSGESPESPLGSIQEAISFAAPGATVRLGAGTYALSAPVTLTGGDGIALDGAGAAVLEPAADEGGNLSRIRLLSVDNATNVAVRGITFRNAYRTVANLGPDEPSVLKTVGTVSAGAYGGAAWVYQSSNVVFEACAFADNRIEGPNSGDVALGAGFGAWGSSDVTVRDCAFTGNRVNGAGSGRGAGVFLDETSGAAVSNCTFTGNYANTQGAGFWAASTSGRVSNSLFVRNSGNQAPLEVRGISTLPFEIDHVTVADNRTRYGISFGGRGNDRVIRDSVVTGQRSAGWCTDDKESNVPATMPTIGENCFWSGDGFNDDRSEAAWAPELDHEFHPTAGGNVARAGAGYRFADAAPAGRTVRVTTGEEFAAAIADLRDYDTVVLAEGDYGLVTSGTDPSAYCPISGRIQVTVRGEGAGARFVGGGEEDPATNGFLRVTDSWGVAFENLTFTNICRSTADPGVSGVIASVSGTANIRFTDCAVLGCTHVFTGAIPYGGSCYGRLLHSAGSTVEFLRTRFCGNRLLATRTAGHYAGYSGGIYYNGRLTLMRECEFSDNVAQTYATLPANGLVFDGANGLTVRNTLFARNVRTADSTGGGSVVYMGWNLSSVYENCTFVANDLIPVVHEHHARSSLCNCVFTANPNGILVARQQDAGASGYISASNCYFDYDPGEETRDVSLFGYKARLLSNANPLYGADVGPVGYKDLEKGDYRLTTASPVVDKGQYRTWMETYDGLDLAGAARIVTQDRKQRKAGAKLPDIGCTELSLHVPGLMLLVR